MKIECTSDEIASVNKKIRNFAFTQNDQGRVDLTVGKTYSVYGKRKNHQGDFYLVLTDSIHNRLPWWMPAELFKVTDPLVPETWTVKSFGKFRKDVIETSPVYFDAIDDIEDGTPRGYDAFEKMQA